MFSLWPIAVSHCLQSRHAKVTQKKNKKVKGKSRTRFVNENEKNVKHFPVNIPANCFMLLPCYFICFACFHYSLSIRFTLRIAAYDCSVIYELRTLWMKITGYNHLCVMWLRLVLTTFSCCHLSIHVNVILYLWYLISHLILRLCHFPSDHCMQNFGSFFLRVIYFNCFLRTMSIRWYRSAEIQNKFNLVKSTTLWLYQHNISGIISSIQIVLCPWGQNQIEMTKAKPFKAFMIRAFLIAIRFRTKYSNSQQSYPLRWPWTSGVFMINWKERKKGFEDAFHKWCRRLLHCEFNFLLKNSYTVYCEMNHVSCDALKFSI